MPRQAEESDALSRFLQAPAADLRPGPFGHGLRRHWGHVVRINLFCDKQFYADFLKLGETPLPLTRIGAGPRGETVVFVLTKANKKHRPNALIARFKALHADV